MIIIANKSRVNQVSNQVLYQIKCYMITAIENERE